MSKLRELELHLREALTARDEGRVDDSLASVRAVLAIAPHHLEGNRLLAELTTQRSDDPATLTGEALSRYSDPDVPNSTRKVPTLSQDELDGLITPAALPGDDYGMDDDGDTNDLALDDLSMPNDLMPGRRRTDSNVSPFLAPLPDDARQKVLARFTHKVVAAGTYVIRRGETQHPLVLVHKGRLDVRVERADGVPIQLASITVGEYIGEGALLERKPAAANVIAATDAEVLLLDPKSFYEVAAAYPALWAELKDSAERRRREQDQKLKR